jgi:hypothetical protein
MGRQLPVRWSEQDGVYWMDRDVAQMFDDIRA